jgi:transposase
MTVYIGVDLHVGSETVCWTDTDSGETSERKLDHQGDEVRAFYSQFVGRVIVGVEASGYSLWFHRLIEELGHELRVGDSRVIRQFARRRQKNDLRDARLILDLLLREDFPRVHVPAPASREVLGLLRYRHRLVRIRTMLRNGLQAVALNHQLRLRAKLFTSRGQQQFAALPLAGADQVQREHSLHLLASLDAQIEAIQELLEQKAQSDLRVIRVRTHPGVGLLTALAVVHLLEPVTRFDRARRVAAYCGLDPREHSSGEVQRFGHISKQGDRLLRWLLTEAAFIAVRHDEELRRFYFHLLVKKNSAVAIVAVARKLALRLYRMLREEIDYDEFRRRGRDARRARKSTSSHSMSPN